MVLIVLVANLLSTPISDGVKSYESHLPEPSVAYRRGLLGTGDGNPLSSEVVVLFDRAPVAEVVVGVTGEGLRLTLKAPVWASWRAGAEEEEEER